MPDLEDALPQVSRRPEGAAVLCSLGDFLPQASNQELPTCSGEKLPEKAISVSHTNIVRQEEEEPMVENLVDLEGPGDMLSAPDSSSCELVYVPGRPMSVPEQVGQDCALPDKEGEVLGAPSNDRAKSRAKREPAGGEDSAESRAEREPVGGEETPSGMTLASPQRPSETPSVMTPAIPHRPRMSSVPASPLLPWKKASDILLCGNELVVPDVADEWLGPWLPGDGRVKPRGTATKSTNKTNETANHQPVMGQNNGSEPSATYASPDSQQSLTFCSDIGTHSGRRVQPPTRYCIAAIMSLETVDVVIFTTHGRRVTLPRRNDDAVSLLSRLLAGGHIRRCWLRHSCRQCFRSDDMDRLIRMMLTDPAVSRRGSSILCQPWGRGLMEEEAVRGSGQLSSYSLNASYVQPEVREAGAALIGRMDL